MTHAEIYPLADHTTEWAQDNFNRGTFTTVEKLLVHSTETLGWPGYGLSHTDAPSCTYNPRSRAWRQHNYIGSSARSLEDPTTTPVRENRDNVVQVEVIGYSDETIADATPGSTKMVALPETALQDLGDFMGWLHIEWGLPIVSTVTWKHYPESSGLDNGVRLTSDQYDAARGLLGHMHASGNHHGDPSLIDEEKILAYARAYVAAHTSAPAPAPGPVVVPVSTKPVLQAVPTIGGPRDVSLANVHPGMRNTDVARYSALLWAEMNLAYRVAHHAAWVSEPSNYMGPVTQKVTLDLYTWLHKVKGWPPPPSAPAWPGPALIHYLGGIPHVQSGVSA